MNFRELVEHARKYIDSDPGRAVYMVRDRVELAEMDLDDLAWALCHPSFSEPTSSNVHGLFEHIDRELTKQVYELIARPMCAQ